MMRAVVVREHGDLNALLQESVPEPIAGPGEVVVRVKACGVNHLDLWVRRGVPGHKFPLPLILGNDVAGVIDSVGPGVTDLGLGTAVVVAPGTSCGVCQACLSGRDHTCRNYQILGEHRDGGYAQLLCVPRVNVMPKPENLSFEQAAALGVSFLTAWHMLVSRAELRPGETVLIQAAGSGVGSAAVQVAKLWGAEVIAAASTDAKLASARSLGANHLINTTNEDTAKRVKAITSGRGVEVVIEHVGPATWASSVKSMGWQGRLVTCGATTGGEVPLNLRHLFFKSLSFLGSTMGSKGEFMEILAHAARGTLRPVVDTVLPLAEAAEAHRRLDAREVFGKLVLTP
jgi:NADPH:quinone reductase-like Zn-dependent oxidoreductase